MAGSTHSSRQQGRAVVVITVVVCLLAAFGLYLTPASGSVGEIYRFVSPADEPFIDGHSKVLAHQIRTTTGEQLGIRLRSGDNLRLDASTEISLHSDSALSLTRGTLYWDAGVLARERHITISSGQARIRAQDAQLEVAVDGSLVQLRLRSGVAEFEIINTGAQTLLRPGSTLRYDGNEVQLTDSTGSRASWAWVQALAATPVPTEVNALEYLEWVAHETGRKLDFANGAAAQFARNSALDSAIDLTTPEASLKWVRMNSDLGAKIRYSNSAIIVR